MAVITERARAKINLTLRVLGRRADGYHELESLVAFADVGDVITLNTDALAVDDRTGWTVTMSGPFAGALVGDNLIATTLQRLVATCPALRLGAVHLDKQLPVASGLGGGSADAAAGVRAVRRANADNPAGQDVPWEQIAASLGADVPVCFANGSAWMQGIGDRLQPVPGLPDLHAVLVNPLGAVPPDKTARVFRTLNAPPSPTAQPDPEARRETPLPAVLAEFGGPGMERAERCRALLAFMREQGNSLSVATQQVVPEISDVIRALNSVALGLEATNITAAPEIGTSAPQAPAPATLKNTGTLVAMSGAGPTCFVVVPSAAHAAQIAATLRRRQPTWWVAATRFGRTGLHE